MRFVISNYMKNYNILQSAGKLLPAWVKQICYQNQKTRRKMKRQINLLLILIISGLTNMGFDVYTEWKISDDHYTVRFTSDEVNGYFTGLTASIRFDEAHPEMASISASIDAASIRTGFFLKNNHARSKDALNVDKYPAITFVSGNVKKAGSQYEAMGRLSIKGITRPAVIYFSFDQKENNGIFKGSFTLAPKDFNIIRHGTPDHVKVDLIIPVTK